MKCVILVMPNEEIQGFNSLENCGLDIEIIKHPVTLYNEDMSLKCADLSKYGIRNFMGRDLYKFEASLLNSWIDMLKAYEDTEDDYILFAESDVLPIYKMSKDLLINDNTKQYDVIRPFLYLDVDNVVPLQNINEDENKWIDGFQFLFGGFRSLVKYPFSMFRYKCGTHALLVSKEGIKKLIKVFTEITAPADVALEYGILLKKIKVGIPTHNFFVQYDRPSWNEHSMRDKQKHIYKK